MELSWAKRELVLDQTSIVSLCVFFLNRLTEKKSNFHASQEVARAMLAPSTSVLLSLSKDVDTSVLRLAQDERGRGLNPLEPQ